jgi:hypothetical protein
MISLLYIPGSQAIATLHLLVDPVVCTALTNVTAINAGLLRSVHGMSVAVFNVKTRSPTRSRFSKNDIMASNGPDTLTHRDRLLHSART